MISAGFYEGDKSPHAINCRPRPTNTSGHLDQLHSQVGTTTAVPEYGSPLIPIGYTKPAILEMGVCGSSRDAVVLAPENSGCGAVTRGHLGILANHRWPLCLENSSGAGLPRLSLSVRGYPPIESTSACQQLDV